MKISEIKDELEKIRESQNFRSVSDIRMISATRGVDENQKEYIVFSSNNYLGLSHEKSVIEAAKNALSFGTGSTGSRLTSGSSFELSRLEKNLASFKQTQDALVFGTGYMTNLGVLYSLADKKSLIFSDQLNHASIIDGCKISGAKVYVYRHNDMNHLEKLLEESQGMVAEEGFQRFLVTDGVFSMDGDVVNLPDLIALKEKYGFCLIVDDAHALGVIGEKGRGTEEYFSLHGKIDIQIGTLSKALASEGGYVAASHEICDFLRNKSRPFIFSTALPPSVAAAADQALSLLREYGSAYMEKIRENSLLMRILLEKAGLPLIKGETAIIPILTGSAGKALTFAKNCRSQGILLSAIRPPSVPVGTARIRLTVTAAHSREEIEEAAEIMIKIWSKI